MANKMTQRDYFNEIIALARENNRADLVEFAQGRIEMLDKKKSGSKPTKTQEENIVYMDEILSVLTSEGATVSEIQTKSEVLTGLSNQKISALLKKLVDGGKAIKTMDKKKALFTLAE